MWWQRSGATRGSAPKSIGSYALRILAATLVSLAPAACSDSTAPEPVPNGEPELELLVDGLDGPVYLTAPPGDPRLFIVERPGAIRVVADGSLLSAPFLDISSSVSTGGERGLLSMAFHPDYASNGWFYINYTGPAGETRIERYTVSGDPDVADEGSAMLVLEVAQPENNHNGGQIAFGPDGMLYIGMGDGGGSGDPDDHGENPATLLGSMLRIDVDGGSPYTVPADNPFVGHATYRPETWAYGFRNPWRFSFDRQTSDLLIADVGEAEREEIDFQPASSGGGENYGWNTLEGTDCHEPASDCDDTGLVPPIHEYEHPDGCSITGGYVYRGAAVPSFQGRYFFGDYCAGWIRSFRIEGGAAVDVVEHSELGTVAQLVSFGEDTDGELYVMGLDGSVYRFVLGGS